MTNSNHRSGAVPVPSGTRRLGISFGAALVAATLLLSACRHTHGTTPLKPDEAYLDFSLKACDVVESQLPEITRVAEKVAQRHLNGGLIGVSFNGQALQQELLGRSGGMVCVGFERSFKPIRTEAEKSNDVLIVSWERTPGVRDYRSVEEEKERGCYVIGFGPRKMPALADYVKMCDVWFDTGFGDDDRVVRLDDGSMAGRGNCLMNTLHGWALTAEIVSALTRHGKMPTMWKSYSYADGVAWGSRYLFKKQFHDDYQVAPIPRARLAKEYLDHIRGYLNKFERTQLPAVELTADMIARESRQGNKTVMAISGHMPYTYVGKYEDKRWARVVALDGGIPSEETVYADKTADGALVVVLGYCGQPIGATALFERKHQREVLICVDNPRPEWQIPTNLVARIDMGWEFGDACVPIKGYPIKILPPSGVMQQVAYECINVEALDRINGVNIEHPTPNIQH